MILNKRTVVTAAIIIAAAAGGFILEHYRGETFTTETITYSENGTYSSIAPSEINGKININAASADELELLDGIGPALAQRIVDYRAENGAFLQTEGIMLVPGIGEKMYEDLKDSICIGE